MVHSIGVAHRNTMQPPPTSENQLSKPFCLALVSIAIQVCETPLRQLGCHTEFGMALGFAPWSFGQFALVEGVRLHAVTGELLAARFTPDDCWDACRTVSISPRRTGLYAGNLPSAHETYVTPAVCQIADFSKPEKIFGISAMRPVGGRISSIWPRQHRSFFLASRTWLRPAFHPAKLCFQ